MSLQIFAVTVEWKTELRASPVEPCDSPEDIMDIVDAARTQHGVLTRAQALGYGLSERQIDYRLSAQEWIRLHPGTYQLRSSPSTWESRLLAAVFCSGGIASHRCAATLWNLDVFHAPDIEITIPNGGWQKITGALVHRTTQWDRCCPVTKRSIPTTGVERTILDCAGVLRFETVERLAESAIRQNLTSWTALADCLKDHSKRGRNGCLSLRTLLEFRLGNGTVPLSDFSRRVVNLLVDNGIERPVVEHRILDDDGRLILQTDLAWPQHRKAWELDGLRWHFGRDDVERDRRKRNRAKAQGWNIQEILWSMYVDNPDELVQLARKFLRP